LLASGIALSPTPLCHRHRFVTGTALSNVCYIEFQVHFPRGLDPRVISDNNAGKYDLRILALTLDYGALYAPT